MAKLNLYEGIIEKTVGKLKKLFSNTEEATTRLERLLTVARETAFIDAHTDTGQTFVFDTGSYKYLFDKYCDQVRAYSAIAARAPDPLAALHILESTHLIGSGIFGIGGIEKLEPNSLEQQIAEYSNGSTSELERRQIKAMSIDYKSFTQSTAYAKPNPFARYGAKPNPDS